MAILKFLAMQSAFESLLLWPLHKCQLFEVKKVSVYWADKFIKKKNSSLSTCNSFIILSSPAISITYYLAIFYNRLKFLELIHDETQAAIWIKLTFYSPDKKEQNG